MNGWNDSASLKLVYNSKIWVSDSIERHWFTFNPSSGRVIDIGTNPHPKKDDYKEAIDAGSCRIFPGFHESHIHVSSLGKSLMSADFKGCRSIKEMQVRNFNLIPFCCIKEVELELGHSSSTMQLLFFN